MSNSDDKGNNPPNALPKLNPNAPANPLRDQIATATAVLGADEIAARLQARGVPYPAPLMDVFLGVLAAAFCCGWDIATELRADGEQVDGDGTGGTNGAGVN